MKTLKSLCFLGGGIGIGIGVSKVICEKYKKRSNKYEKLFRLYESWLTLSQNGEKLEQYFSKKSINNIAIYGYGATGRALVNELRHSDIKIKYIVDEKKAIKTEGICLYHPSDELPGADALIITPLTEGRQIKEKMKKKFSGNLLLIEDILYECL